MFIIIVGFTFEFSYFPTNNPKTVFVLRSIRSQRSELANEYIQINVAACGRQGPSWTTLRLIFLRNVWIKHSCKLLIRMFANSYEDCLSDWLNSAEPRVTSFILKHAIAVLLSAGLLHVFISLVNEVFIFTAVKYYPSYFYISWCFNNHCSFFGVDIVKYELFFIVDVCFHNIILPNRCNCSKDCAIITSMIALYFRSKK